MTTILLLHWESKSSISNTYFENEQKQKCTHRHAMYTRYGKTEAERPRERESEILKNRKNKNKK